MKVLMAQGKCSLCKKQDEGILITWCWFIRGFICEGCISKIFGQFSRKR